MIILNQFEGASMQFHHRNLVFLYVIIWGKIEMNRYLRKKLRDKIKSYVPFFGEFLYWFLGHFPGFLYLRQEIIGC